METLKLVNFIISIIFMLCYAYQFVYIPIPWLMKKRKSAPEKPHRFAVMICARNEAEVIADLIASLREQTYRHELIHIFVLADNCTDKTADTARAAGAVVYERFNSQLIGKGYALTELMGHLKEDYPDGFDGYFVFDADNILAPDYIEQMNRTFSEGFDVISSYRNSKNYGDNWISAGYALWFLRESRYLNHARHLLGTSCAVSGTGFLFSRKVAEEIGDWPFHMLTEDIEFSVNQIVNGRRIAFCPDAELYDEQPVTFAQSWRQRMRWARGYLQVFHGYGVQLIKGIFKGHFSCFDISMSIMPAFILSILSILCNVVLGIWGACIGDNIMIAVRSIGELLINVYLTLFAIGFITTLTEWKQIHTGAMRKLLFTLTFPLFMFTYIPISFTAIFRKPEWKPITHSVTAAQMKQREKR